ncbi:MAG TPA: hypothetical protein P5075_01710 [Eubacteriales bacterium]|nr:hypothetical protein [Eubacteriales bacterium]
MLLYHGSSRDGLQTLQPSVADHGKPYVYFSTSEIAACFYAANAVPRPHYWFPYGYDAAGKVIYTETYPNAFRDVYEGRQGYLYACEIPEDALLRFPSNPHLRISAEPVAVARTETIGDLCEWFLRRENEGKLIIQRYETLAPAVLSAWHSMVLEDLRAAAANAKDSAYSDFVRSRMPAVWERFTRQPEYDCSYTGPII